MKINLKSVLGISLFDHYIFQLIGKVCVLILGTYQSLRRIGIRQRENAAKRIEHIDSSFDELWAATKSTIDNTPLRTSAVLDWYCSATEDFEKILFGYYEHGELKGYALFNTNIHMERGIKYLDCIDIWGRHRSTEMINAVIIAATDYAEDNAIDMVTFSSFDDEVGDCFKRVGRIGFTSARPRYFKTNANNQEAIYQSQSYFTKFLGDYAL